MGKKILVFSNGEKIGDGIIKLPLLFEIRDRLKEYEIIWVTNKGKTAYNNQLKNITSKFIDKIIEEVNISPFFWKKISSKYNFENEFYDYIFDTQKVVIRTIALKRIKCKNFISSSANGFFSSKKLIKRKNHSRRYYLEELLDLLDLITLKNSKNNFNIQISNQLENQLSKIFKNENKYFGIAPGAGEKDRIWPIEKFIEVGQYFVNKNFKIVFFLGPEEQKIKEKLISIFPTAIIPEDLIKNFSNIETVISSTKFLDFALTNDSGIGHILTLGHCNLFKIFGHKDSNKFTPIKDNVISFTSQEFNSNDIKSIPVKKVLETIDKFNK